MVNKIKKLCKIKNVSLTKVSQDLGFGAKSMFHWDENNPSVAKVKLVADYFGVTVDYLLQPEFWEQLEGLMDANHMDVADLCQYLQIPVRDAMNLLSGALEPDDDMVDRIADYFDVDPEYLTGKKPELQIVKLSDLTPGEQRIVQYYRELSDENKKKAELMLHVLGVE